MPKEVSAGAIIFKKNKEIRYLLLFKEAKDNFRALWGFPRGNIEKNENEKETVKREVEEETGIKNLKFLDFREKINWFYKKEEKTIYKESIFYLVESKDEKIKISEEHNDFRWCSYEEADKLLRFKNIKEVLKKADEFLKKSL